MKKIPRKNGSARLPARLSVLSLILCILLAACMLAACGGGKSASAGSSDAGAAVAETTAAAMDTAMGQSNGPIGYRNHAMVMEAETAAPAAPGEEGIQPGGSSDGNSGGSPEGNTVPGSTAPIQPAQSGRKLIRTVDLQVETTDFDGLLASLTQSVADAGGYVEQSDISGNSIASSQGGRRYASLTARVPSDKLDGFLGQVDAQGNITNKSESTQDVTLAYSDIEGRKKTLQVEQERLWELLAQADSIDAVIALESRLSEIRYQLESFESQLRTYDNQVDYSTVYLNLHEVAALTATSPDSVLTRIQKGFARNLDAVGNGLLNFFVGLITSLPMLVVIAVAAAVIGLIIRAFARHMGRGKRRKLPPGPPQQPAPPLQSPPPLKDQQDGQQQEPQEGQQKSQQKLRQQQDQ